MGSPLCFSAVFGVQCWGGFVYLPEAVHRLLAERQAQCTNGLAVKGDCSALLCTWQGECPVAPGSLKDWSCLDWGGCLGWVSSEDFLKAQGGRC